MCLGRMTINMPPFAPPGKDCGMNKNIYYSLPAIFVFLLTSAVQLSADPREGRKRGKEKHWEEKEARKEEKKDRKESGKRRGDHHEERGGRDYEEHDWWRNVRGRVNHGRFSVPPGHRPPPGMCRRWNPGLPPGQQPPPEDCSRMRSGRDEFILYGDTGYDPRYDWRRDRDRDTLRELPHVLLDILIDRM
jgi:hypothetical protein